jgi:hydroxyacyl-ACP dehydratase HTD2-like protein with hotdog domain
MPTSPLLFRFSALTFNGHRIHYDKPWAQQREGHPDIVFHGPLSALLLVELAGRSERSGRTLKRFSYRAVHPMYVDKEITFASKWKEDGVDGEMELWASQDGIVGMIARASFSPS